MNVNNPIAAEMFSYMAPTTLVAFITDLDVHMSVDADRTVRSLMTMALEALYCNVGASSAIDMLADAGVDAMNPVVEEAVNEWLEAA